MMDTGITTGYGIMLGRLVEKDTSGYRDTLPGMLASDGWQDGGMAWRMPSRTDPNYTAVLDIESGRTTIERAWGIQGDVPIDIIKEFDGYFSRILSKMMRQSADELAGLGVE